MDIELTGTHILFLGLRYAGWGWRLTEYPAKTEMDKLTKELVKSAGKAKKEIKKKEEVQEEVKNDVSEDCKQAGS